MSDHDSPDATSRPTRLRMSYYEQTPWKRSADERARQERLEQEAREVVVPASEIERLVGPWRERRDRDG